MRSVSRAPARSSPSMRMVRRVTRCPRKRARSALVAATSSLPSRSATPYTDAAAETEMKPKRTSRTTADASRPVGSPYPPPPAVRSITTSPARKANPVTLPGSGEGSTSSPPRRTVKRFGAPVQPPRTPYGGMTFLSESTES